MLARAKFLMQDHDISRWIDLFAMPVAASIMETQPVALALLSASLLLTRHSQSLPLEAGSITLLMLSLYWWALLVKRMTRTRDWKPLPQLLSLLGLLLALATLIGMHSSFLHNIPALLLTAGLIIWLWQRALSRAQTGFEGEKLLTSFRLGFLTLIAILCLTVLNFLPAQAMILNALIPALPIYFLSGLVTLSLPHLTIASKGERARATARAQQGNRGHAVFHSTRIWLILLLCLWLVILVAAIALDFITFQSLVSVLAALWNVVSAPLSAINAFITWLLSLSSPAPVHRNPCVPNAPNCKVLPLPTPQPYANPILVAVVLIVLLLALLAIITAVLRNLSLAYRTEDELREGISLRAFLEARRQRRQRQRKAAFELEALEPNSARMRYREFLQAMARRKDDLVHRPDETPAEYQARLSLTLERAQHAQHAQHNTAQKDDASSETAILDELTCSYISERYGEKHSDTRQRTYLRGQVPLLIKRLTRRKFPVAPVPERK